MSDRVTAGKVHVPFSISDEDLIDSVIDMAGYGIGYWAYAATVDEDARTYTVHYEDPDDEEGKEATATLTFQKIVNAMGELAGHNYHPSKYIMDAILHNDWGNIDADAADIIIQWAIFEAVVYG